MGSHHHCRLLRRGASNSPWKNESEEESMSSDTMKRLSSLLLLFVGLGTLVVFPLMSSRAQAATGVWTFTGSLTTPRFAATATLLNSERILVTGGINLVPNNNGVLLETSQATSEL